MNVLKLLETFQTQEQAVEYLEQVRWRGRPMCPYCQSEKVGQHASGDRAGHRWQCRDCSRPFAVTVGTLFHGTHMPLRQWFFVLAMMLNTKEKSASAYQIARDTGMRRATVRSMMQRIRTAIAAGTNESRLLYGIVEADEPYVGGKPRKGNNWDEDGDKPKERRRGTNKVPVLGAVERGGCLVARIVVSGDLSAKGIAMFIKRFMDPAEMVLITGKYGRFVGSAR